MNIVKGGSVAEWLACWTQAQKGLGSVTTLPGNSLRKTVHTHLASVYQAARLVTALLRVAGVLQACRKVMAALRGKLRAWRKVMAAYRRVYDSRHLQADCEKPGSAPELYAR